MLDLQDAVKIVNQLTRSNVVERDCTEVPDKHGISFEIRTNEGKWIATIRVVCHHQNTYIYHCGHYGCNIRKFVGGNRVQCRDIEREVSIIETLK